MTAPPVDGAAALDPDQLLALADDALVAAQWLGGWVAQAPVLEEDVALANIALDQLGVARALLTWYGEGEGRGRSEDDLAYLRPPEEFRNALLVERPDGQDFAVLVVRLLLLSTTQLSHYAALRSAPDPVVAGVLTKAVAEVTYHRDHARTWLLRLGDGTAESHERAQRALDAEWPYLAELVTTDVAGAVRDQLTADITAATLVVPPEPADAAAYSGGREGRHTEHLARLLATMQEIARAHPGAVW